MSFKVTWKIHLLCLIFAFTICIIEQDNIPDLFFNLFMNNIILNFTGNALIDMSLFMFIIFIPITFVHEFLHGTAYKLFGGKVRYGFKGIYAYALETSGKELHRTKFLIILLAPMTLISVLSLFINNEIGAIVFWLNLLGSSGDVLMAFYLCKSNENSYVLDKNYGFDIIHVQDQI